MKEAIYADGLAIRCSKEYISTADYRLQLVLQEIQAWTKAWLVRINVKKDNIHSDLSIQATTKVKPQINSKPLRADDSPTYLGVTLDRRLTLRNQVYKNQAKAKVRMSLMKKLAGTCWGQISVSGRSCMLDESALCWRMA